MSHLTAGGAGVVPGAGSSAVSEDEITATPTTPFTRSYVQTSHGAAADKPAGVVALTCFDLRRSGLVRSGDRGRRAGTRNRTRLSHLQQPPIAP